MPSKYESRIANTPRSRPYFFSIAMLWGIVVGTYSSLFIAAPLLYYIRPKRGAVTKETAGEPLPSRTS